MSDVQGFVYKILLVLVSGQCYLTKDKSLNNITKYCITCIDILNIFMAGI